MLNAFFSFVVNLFFCFPFDSRKGAADGPEVLWCLWKLGFIVDLLIKWSHQVREEKLSHVMFKCTCAFPFTSSTYFHTLYPDVSEILCSPPPWPNSAKSWLRLRNENRMHFCIPLTFLAAPERNGPRTETKEKQQHVWCWPGADTD